MKKETFRCTGTPQ